MEEFVTRSIDLLFTGGTGGLVSFVLGLGAAHAVLSALLTGSWDDEDRG